MVTFLLSIFFLLPTFCFAESASMETLWALDKEKIKTNETDSVKGFQFARMFLENKPGLTSDCTRFMTVFITTKTQAQNDALVVLIGQGKVHRLMDSFSATNSIGERTTKHVHYNRPKEWQDYSVKVTTP